MIKSFNKYNNISKIFGQVATSKKGDELWMKLKRLSELKKEKSYLEEERLMECGYEVILIKHWMYKIK